MLSCFDVADYLIWVSNTSVASTVNQLKLQKLVYYAQAFHLALYDKPLFMEVIVAWEHGPVVAELWQKYNYYAASPIPSPKNFDISIYSEGEIQLLNGVYSKLGYLHPCVLREQTHQEPTWIDAYPQGIITHKAMKAYFQHSNNLIDLNESKIVKHQSTEHSVNYSSVDSGTSTLTVKSDARESEAFKAYLASKKKRYEVYRRLAQS